MALPKFVSNTKAGQLAFLQAWHRAHARVEDRFRHAKDAGWDGFPSREFDINQATDRHRLTSRTDALADNAM